MPIIRFLAFYEYARDRELLNYNHMTDICASPMFKYDHYVGLKHRYSVERKVDHDFETERKKNIIESSKVSPRLVEGEESANTLIRMFKSSGMTHG